MAELFETYGVPSVAFGVDAAFSYKYNQLRGICDRDGLAICPGFTTPHVIPLKEKKRQIFLKTTTERRQRAKQKRVEEELEREKKTREDEERRLCVLNTKNCMRRLSSGKDSRTFGSWNPDALPCGSPIKLDGFRLYIVRGLAGKSEPLPAVASPPVSDSTNKTVEAPESNGAVSTSLAIAKPQSSSGRIQSFLDKAADEGLVILQSPMVGFFRRSRTIKGKRTPPSCKEKQIVKEGQVLCYIEQLGGEIPIESDVSGEVIKILRDDGGFPLLWKLGGFNSIFVER